MAERKADILVLGAGMVGVGAALHLQQRGRDVILVDRHELAGEETSFGNAGLIECASVFPYMFPRDFGQLFQYAINRAPQVRYQFLDLPIFLPWLLRYFLASSPDRSLHSAMAELPLIQRVPELRRQRKALAGRPLRVTMRRVRVPTRCPRRRCRTVLGALENLKIGSPVHPDTTPP